MLPRHETRRDGNPTEVGHFVRLHCELLTTIRPSTGLQYKIESVLGVNGETRYLGRRDFQRSWYRASFVPITIQAQAT